MAVKSAMVVKTFRVPLTRAPPKVVSMKYFCASSQLTSSRAPGTAGQPTALGCGASGSSSNGSQGNCSGRI